MSMVKRLAKYYTKNSEKADQITGLLNKYGLSSMKNRLKENIESVSEREEQYLRCHIVSSKKLSDSEVDSIIDRAGIPKEVSVFNEVDETVIDGVKVYYKGKKWNDSVKGRLDRFVKS